MPTQQNSESIAVPRRLQMWEDTLKSTMLRWHVSVEVSARDSRAGNDVDTLRQRGTVISMAAMTRSLLPPLNPTLPVDKSMHSSEIRGFDWTENRRWDESSNHCKLEPWTIGSWHCAPVIHFMRCSFTCLKSRYAPLVLLKKIKTSLVSASRIV